MLQHTVDICQSSIDLLLDMPDRIPDWIADGDFTKTRLMFPTMPALHIAYGRYLLTKGEYSRLCGIAEVARQTSSVYPQTLGVIYADIYLAAAYHAMSKENEAMSSLKSALDAALLDRILMPFADNGDYIEDMLSCLTGEERYADAIARILELYRDFERTRRKILREHFPQTDEILSKREMDVARLAAGGFSNREISARLYLSEDGVKSRMKSIFEKLSVTSRKQLADILKL